MTSLLLLLCGLVILITQSAGKSNEQLDGCPINIPRNQYLHSHGQKCFELVTNQKNHWKEARGYCQNNGGDLVTIRDDTEEEFIVSVLRSLNFYGGVWLGLTDLQKEGEYRWVTGDVSTYFNWQSGEPSLLHNFEDCVALKMDSGKWADYSCELQFFNTFPWICEYPRRDTTTILTTLVDTTTAPTTTTGTKTTKTLVHHQTTSLGGSVTEPGKDIIGK